MYMPVEKFTLWLLIIAAATFALTYLMFKAKMLFNDEDLKIEIKKLKKENDELKSRLSKTYMDYVHQYTLKEKYEMDLEQEQRDRKAIEQLRIGDAVEIEELNEEIKSLKSEISELQHKIIKQEFSEAI